MSEGGRRDRGKEGEKEGGGGRRREEGGGRGGEREREGKNISEHHSLQW